MAHTKVTKLHSQNTGVANTFSYSGSFDVFKGTEVVVSLDATDLTFTSSTINESASPREYTVDTAAKTIHIGGADLSSGTIIIRPNTDLGTPTPRATYTPGASITSEDLNNNQLQLLRKAMEYDDTKMSTTGDTMTGHLTMGEDTTIIFEGATDDGYETTLTVTDPTADRTITLPNTTGTVVTTGDTGTVATGMIADDAVDNDKLANSVVSAIAANTAKVTNATHTGDVTGDTTLTIANDAVTSAKIDDGTIVTGNISASAAIDFTKLENLDSAKILVGNSSNKATEVSMSGDIAIDNAGATTIQADAVEIGMIGCEQTTISDSDSHIPTSGAVVDYVAAQIAPIGGLEVIATDAAFPNDQPASGVVISIADAGGLVVNGSGQSTTGRTVGASTVTINGINSSFHSTTIDAGIGMLVTSTGSGQIYDYHKTVIKESDVAQISDDINDFNSRYRIASSAPGSSNDEGDLYFDTGTNKMYVYDGSSWGQVTSTGDFKYLVPCAFNTGTGNAAVFNGSISKYDLRENSTSGSLASITSAAQLMVSVNGVVQKPNTGTSIGSNDGFCLVDDHTIEFGDNIPSSSEVFVIQSGSALSITTPGDNTVTAAKLDLSIVQGDVIYGTGSDTWARLAKGTAGQVLKMNSGATAPEWAADTGLTQEEVEDYVGGMVTGNTETGITVTYDDSDGTLDFVVADQTPTTTRGDIIYRGASADQRLAKGTNGQFLKIGANDPEWADVQGAVADECIYENALTISNPYTIAATKGAHSVGPITLNNTVTVNGRWVIS